MRLLLNTAVCLLMLKFLREKKHQKSCMRSYAWPKKLIWIEHKASKSKMWMLHSHSYPSRTDDLQYTVTTVSRWAPNIGLASSLSDQTQNMITISPSVLEL